MYIIWIMASLLRANYTNKTGNELFDFYKASNNLLLLFKKHYRISYTYLSPIINALENFFSPSWIKEICRKLNLCRLVHASKTLARTLIQPFFLSFKRIIIEIVVAKNIPVERNFASENYHLNWHSV